MLLEALPGQCSVVLGRKSAPVHYAFEAAGRWLEALVWRRSRSATSLSAADAAEGSSSESEDDGDEERLELEEYPLLKSLDPKEWKTQDHYLVLGLGKLRYQATAKQIKAAHKAMVLKHHPDKREATGQRTGNGEDDYFTCITKAYEELGDPVKRRAFDSVDPTFDSSTPTRGDVKSGDFYETFTEVFDRNARWSTKQPVPRLGDESSAFEEVDRFYSFWYNFDSWREFSYLDEEEKDKAECRDERRWIEKQNRAARTQRKKEEMVRLRSLVDLAYSCDSRVRRFRDEEKSRKEAEKRAKADAKKQRQEEIDRARQAEAEAARALREKEEAEARVAAQHAKKEKETLKRALKKERQRLRAFCKTWSYFAEDEAESVRMMGEMEKLCENLELNSLQDLNEALETCGGREAAHEAVGGRLREVEELLERRRVEEAEAQARERAARGADADAAAAAASLGGDDASSATSAAGGGGGGKAWPPEDLQLLIKSVNLFPAGTSSRWEVIASFINSHSLTPGVRRTARDVVAMTKHLQKLDPAQKEELSRRASERLHSGAGTLAPGLDRATPSERDGPGVSESVAPAASESPWTAAEQKLLEQALKTHTGGGPERWDAIARAVPGRTRKECMRRYKELVEMVKAKKAAQEAVKMNKQK
ncbi:dnaJ homolog subfamily C member 2 [Lethenteron reissneri]|uniref:dnaJ homolog subfamily C member 2 n=1 Tax=Lethenteron reissneri TaxID=7753 RepID=UPI002AB663E5|nr:dnaJ homolog subfamily C member 2 [Lethenteron reissneri]